MTRPQLSVEMTSKNRNKIIIISMLIMIPTVTIGIKFSVFENLVKIVVPVYINQDRQLSPQLQKQLIKDIKYIEDISIIISITHGDREAFNYAQGIAKVLKEAGCNITKIERVVFNPEYLGLNIKIADEEISKNAKVLFSAIQKLDKNAELIKDRRFNSGYLALIVGSKRR